LFNIQTDRLQYDYKYRMNRWWQVNTRGEF